MMPARAMSVYRMLRFWLVRMTGGKPVHYQVGKGRDDPEHEEGIPEDPVQHPRGLRGSRVFLDGHGPDVRLDPGAVEVPHVE